MRRCYLLPALLTVMAVPAIGETVPESFCQRLAPQLEMKQVHDRRSDQIVWKMDTATLGMYLIGGTSTISMGPTPIDETSAAEFVRLKDACAATKNGAICQFDGPAKFELKTKRAHANLDVAPDEKVETEIRGTAIICRDKPSR